jgi:amidase
MFKTTVDQGQYKREYMDYWNSTASLTKSGQQVDATLTPVAPYAALQLEKEVDVGKPHIRPLEKNE